MANIMKFIGGRLISKLEEFVCRETGKIILSGINHTANLTALKTNLEKLNAKALDIEDKIKDKKLSGQKKRKREVENWLEAVKKLHTEICTLEGEVESEGFVSKFLGGVRAAQLKESVVELVEQSKHFGELVLEAQKIMGETLLAPKFVGNAFKENLKRIRELLRDDNVTRIGIYGMGGVGKTAFTKHINNRLVKKKTRVFWVMVSQESSIRMLQDKIAHAIRIDDLSNESDENIRAARLYQALSSSERKNFVLILDDVWRNINLEKVGIPLGVKGSKLIITTRSLQVCRQIGCQKLVPVKTLDAIEAWELFSNTLGQEVTLTPQVEEIAKLMAKLCDGLPLGIITLAGSMRGETEGHVWRNALEELQTSVMKHEDMEDHVFEVLKYSFDRLNPKHQEQVESNGGYTVLQRCFLYCSLYPEDHMISKQDLVRKFMSEELAEKRKSRGAQVDQIHTILDKLVNVCLLERPFNDCVKLHDLVRAMALKISQGKNMVLAGCQLEQIPDEDKYWTRDVEKMSLMLNDIKEIPDRISPNCPRLSTLFLQRNKNLKFIADSFFSQLHGLCVLDLSGTGVRKLPNSLSDLESLKALILGGCPRLVHVPYLGKLKQLKELDLSETKIREVPEGMDELVNLKFLSMDEMKYLKILPTGLLLKFRNLECLHLPKQIEAPVIEMESLRKLEEFKGRVKDPADFNRLIGCRAPIRYCIVITPTLEDSKIWDYNVDILKERDVELEDEEDIFAPDAQHLTLGFYEGLSKSLLDNVPKLNNLKSLKTLKIGKCEGIECILAKNGELESHSVALLGTIHEIHLYKLPDFMGIIKEEGIALPTPAQVVFSSLRELNIYHCDKMKNLGLIGLEFPNLESISLEGCEEIEEIIIEEGGVVSFPKLKELTLRNLPKLKHVGTRTICDSIESIDVVGCGALKKLPLCFPVMIEGGESSKVSYSPPPSLETIYIDTLDDEWWESLEWDDPSHEHLLEPFLLYY